MHASRKVYFSLEFHSSDANSEFSFLCVKYRGFVMQTYLFN